MTTAQNRVVVVGGGVAGLAAAYYLQQRDIPHTLLEASDRLGGLVQTVKANGCRVEFGPDAFITRKPWAYDLAKALGLDDTMIAVNPTPERIYILVKGRLVPLPDGLRLLVPTKFGPFLRSRLLSPWGKARVLLDMLLPPKQDDQDESLADFVRRRLGQQALERLADPLLGGVYNAEMERQSILATFPQYRRLEAEHSSLIRGMRTAANRPKPTDAPPALVSFENGMGQFIDTLAGALTGDVRRNAPVTAITQAEGGYRVTVAGETIDTPALVLATPANITAGLLASAAPATARHLGQIRYEGVGSISLAYHRADIPHKLDAYGVVIPAAEKRRIDGMQWSSAKWPGRAPDEIALLRVFFGGPHTRSMLNYDDNDLLTMVRRELRELLGINAAPLHHTVGRWRDAYPQYDVGHLGLIEQAKTALPPGIQLAGNAYQGVGLPDTIHSAQLAAAALAEYLNPKPKPYAKQREKFMRRAYGSGGRG